MAEKRVSNVYCFEQEKSGYNIIFVSMPGVLATTAKRVMNNVLKLIKYNLKHK